MPRGNTIRGDGRTEAEMAKTFGGSQPRHAAERCVENCGGMRLAIDLPIKIIGRDQRGMMVTEGPIEIPRMALARHLLRIYS